MPTPSEGFPKEGTESTGQPNAPSSARIPPPSRILFYMRINPDGSVNILYQ